MNTPEDKNFIIGISMLLFLLCLGCMGLLAVISGTYLLVQNYQTAGPKEPVSNPPRAATIWVQATAVAEERATASAQPTPFGQPTPTLSIPVLKGTPYPYLFTAISPENAGQVVQLARWGTEGEVGNQITFFPDGCALAVGTGQDGVLVLDAVDGHNIKLIPDDFPPVNRYSSYVTFSPGGNYILVDNGYLNIYRASDFEPVDIQLPFIRANISVTGMAAAQDEETLALGYSSGHLILVELITGDLIRNLVTEEDTIRGLDFSPDGEFLASASEDGVVRLYTVNNDYKNFVLHVSVPEATYLEFSPDSQLVAVSNKLGEVVLLQAADGIEHLTLAHPDQVNQVSFSPDGQIIATACEDRLIRLWRVFDGKLLAELKGHSQGVFSVDFSPDGSLLASQGREAAVRIWGRFRKDSFGRWALGFRIFFCLRRVSRLK